MRFGPKFREVGANAIEECSMLWRLYEASKGYQLQEYNKLNDYLALLVSGSAQMSIPTTQF